jgi:hypothetical protein
MLPLANIGRDSADRQYFATTATSLESLPWGDEQFDALVFVAAAAAPAEVEQALRSLVTANTNWIFTAGTQAGFWHDRVDHVSVEVGRQQQVGDGSPMTAWFDEIQSLDQWDTAHNFGDSDYFLFVIVGSKEPLNSLAMSLSTADA